MTRQQLHKRFRAVVARGLARAEAEEARRLKRPPPSLPPRRRCSICRLPGHKAPTCRRRGEPSIAGRAGRSKAR